MVRRGTGVHLLQHLLDALVLHVVAHVHHDRGVLSEEVAQHRATWMPLDPPGHIEATTAIVKNLFSVWLGHQADKHKRNRARGQPTHSEAVVIAERLRFANAIDIPRGFWWLSVV